MPKECAQETGKARDGNKVGGGSVSFPCLDCRTACTSSSCRRMRLLLLSTWSQVHSRDQDRQDEVLLFGARTVHTHDCSPPRELLHWRTIRDRINKGAINCHLQARARVSSRVSSYWCCYYIVSCHKWGIKIQIC